MAQLQESRTITTSASTLLSPRRLLDTAAWLTTPLLPDDYLGLINPLWSTRELRGRVESVQPETADAATLTIRPGWGWGGHQAGQYIGVGVDIDGVWQWRNYSLTSPAGRHDRLSITISAVPNGRVSQHLVHRTAPGAVLRLRAAQGEFVLPNPVPPRLLFLTAGSGITPVMGILRTLAARGTMPDVVLVHSAPTPTAAIFSPELRHLCELFPTLRLHQRHTKTEGRLTLADLPAWCPDWQHRQVWACGPNQMLDQIERHWQAAGHGDQLHVERFRPPALPAGAGNANRVRFARTGREVDADQATPLLAVGEDAGVVMPSGCRMGICFGCVIPLTYGQVRDLRTGQVHGDEGELVQTCVSAAATPIELDL